MNIKLLISIIATILILFIFFFSFQEAYSDELSGIRKIKRIRVPRCKCPEGEVYFFDYLSNTPYCGTHPLGLYYNPNTNIPKAPANKGFCEVRLYTRTVPQGIDSTRSYQYLQTTCSNQANNTCNSLEKPLITVFPPTNSQVQNYRGAQGGPIIIKTVDGRSHKINTKAACPLGHAYIPAANMCTSFHKPQCEY